MAPCAEKKRLNDTYFEALRKVIHLHTQEATAVAGSSGWLERFDLALEQARQKRDAAKMELLLHIHSHGC